MAEDRDGVVRLPDDQLAVLGQALREGAVRMPPGSEHGGDVLTGREAAVLRRTISLIIDDELSRRQVLPEGRIREIAKEVAHGVYVELIRGVEERLRGFFTEEGIEQIVFDILKDVGLKADKDHADATREAVDGLIRGYRRRAEAGGDFLKEFVKALATLSAGGAVAALTTYLALKGGSH